MELNGLSNIANTIMLREMNAIDESAMLQKIKEQVNLLNRYMVEYGKNPLVAWHEVRENPGNYPIQGAEIK